MGIQYEKEKLKELDEEIQKFFRNVGKLQLMNMKMISMIILYKDNWIIYIMKKEKVQAQIDKYNYYKNLGDIKRNSKYVEFWK